MGEIAEMMLDGTLCEGCGVYMAGGGHSVPQRCGNCELDDAQPAPSARVACKECGRAVKFAGLADHMRDAHGKQKKPTRAARLLAALRQLHDVCVGMDLDNQMERPTEEAYQAAMAAAKKAIAEADASPHV